VILVHSRIILRVVAALTVTVVASIVAVTGKLWLERNAADRAVQEQVARLDQIDPIWTFDEMEARRPEIAADENGALLVLNIARQIPAGWPSWNVRPPNAWEEPTDKERELGEQRRRVSEEIDNRGFRESLSPFVRKSLDTEMERVAKAIAATHNLTQFPTGRYRFDMQLVWPRTVVGDLQKGREVAQLLALRSLQLSQQGKPEEACKAVLCLCHVGCSYGEPGTLIAHLVRIAVMHIAVSEVEHALALGEASSSTLARLQERFETEAEQTPHLMLHAARSERAMTHRMLEALWDGRITLNDLGGMGLEPDSWWDRVALKVGMGPLRAQHAAFLGETTEEIEKWREPWDPHEETPNAALRVEMLQGQQWYRNFVDGLQQVKHAGLRTQATMRCAALAMACERYRLDHQGSWPASLQQLVPVYAKAVPVDPYGAGPMRMARKEDGLIIYSVWKDGKDNGGNLDRTARGVEGTDLGFQLWHAAGRVPVHRDR
jgi:hypothetical protein